MAQKRKPYRRLSESYKKRRRIVYRNRILLLLGIIFLAGTGVRVIKGKNPLQGIRVDEQVLAETPVDWRGAPAINVQLLTPNPYSRPQLKLSKVKGIVIHYTGNAGTSAQANHDYFESLKDGSGTSASSHFVVGLDGEVIQCIPSSEEAYASNARNVDTLSIETCHPDETGKFNESTYNTLIQLTGWLCVQFDLKPDDVIRHYDVTGKICPKYFVEHEDAWQQFKEDVGNKMEEIREYYA